MKEEIFDSWPKKYESWFQTEIGKLVLQYEKELVACMALPAAGEKLLDAGCGTGLFTEMYQAAGADITALDLSFPMLLSARGRMPGARLVRGDMLRLPFKDESFDTCISITALEFIEEGTAAVDELFRVTRPGGRVLVATLNSLSSWADERKARAAKEGGLFSSAWFRSPADLLAMRKEKGRSGTAVHFQSNIDAFSAGAVEEKMTDSDTGAFVAVIWKKSR